MASRRDELNAYGFARKRMVGAFLQPSGGGNDEDAPRPVRAVLPSLVVAAVITAGFGMWGVIKPAAPQGWDDGKNIVQGTDSTTRYVVLTDPVTHQPMLHQVLNMSSAKLVLPAGSKVVPVADSVLDAYKSRGATIGIQYAPDKLPKPEDAGVAKKWSACDRPGVGGLESNINQSVFVAADSEAKRLAKPGLMLAGNDALFVQGPDETVSVPKSDKNPDDVVRTTRAGSVYLVDSQGYKHALGDASTSDGNLDLLKAALFGTDAKAQRVTKQWLDTLGDGGHIDFPKLDDRTGSSQVKLSNSADRKVGRLVKFNNSFFVVGTDKLYMLTAFQAQLMTSAPGLPYSGGSPTFADMSPDDYKALQNTFDTDTLKPKADEHMPTDKPAAHPVNFAGSKARTVICSTLESVGSGGDITRSVWADTDYPAAVPVGSSSAYVSAGHGLLFRAMQGGGADASGSTYLITETGLRYALQANADGGKSPSASASADPQSQTAQSQQPENAQARLGYDKVTPVLVPSAWANLVPSGPPLSTAGALQAQTS